MSELEIFLLILVIILFVICMILYLRNKNLKKDLEDAINLDEQHMSHMTPRLDESRTILGGLSLFMKALGYDKEYNKHREFIEKIFKDIQFDEKDKLVIVKEHLEAQKET